MITQEPLTVTDASVNLAQRRAFLRLSLEERRRQLAAQAAQTVDDYNCETQTKERAAWQEGDVFEY